MSYERSPLPYKHAMRTVQEVQEVVHQFAYGLFDDYGNETCGGW